MEKNEIFEKLTGAALELGAFKAAVIPTSEVKTDPIFRKMCADNLCGNYGKCWTCPPFNGEIGDLMQKVHEYQYAMVFQSVGALEDSYDFEGMQEAAQKHNRLVIAFRKRMNDLHLPKTLLLGAGGCRLCEVCAKKTDEPCRHPEDALSSLEAYGVNVSETAKAAGMKYINGQNTVTYFSAVFFDL